MTRPPRRVRSWRVALAALALTTTTACAVFQGEEDTGTEADREQTGTGEPGEADDATDEPDADEDTTGEAAGEADEILLDDFERRHSLEFEENLFLDVYGLVDDGQVLTLYWGWRNERDDDADFRWDRFGDGDGDGAKLRLLDLANGKRYQVLKDENGDCLCSHTDNVNTTLPPEGTKIMTNLYPLPEDDVDTLTLTTPQDGNIDGIAISEQ